ncbi:MAG: hypothetical protein C0498_05995 [Anaerolinea sp.]|nr:hypothetical protein [Anaerolinea sp.]
MIGPLALHGGGEFLSGDEPFLRHLIKLAVAAARERVRACAPGNTTPGGTPVETVRVELLTTAVARHRPDLAFAVGSAALERLAAEAADAPDAPDPGALTVRIRHARAVDATSAEDATIAGRLAGADLVYLPGGDPDAVVEILAGTLAWRSVEAARARGAVVAGASAGAMALGERTWMRDGLGAGFGWAGRLAVVPHATAERVVSMRSAVDGLPRGTELAILGLPERTGVTGRPGAWVVVGDAGVWWWPPHAPAPRHEPAGAIIRD